MNEILNKTVNVNNIQDEVKKISRNYEVEIGKRDTLVEELWLEIKKYRKNEKSLLSQLQFSKNESASLKKKISEME